MSNIKGKVSLLLAIIMMTLTILPMTVGAASEIMKLTAKKDGEVLTTGASIEAKAGNQISVSVDVASTNGLVIYYSWDRSGLNKASTGSKTATITVPSYEAGSKHTLQIEAVINDKQNGLVGNSNVVALYVNFPSNDVDDTTISTTVKNGSSKLPSKAELATGTKLTLSAESNKGVKSIAYRWDNESLIETRNLPATITVPSTFLPGTTHTLKVQAVAIDGTKSASVTYTITIPKAEDIDDELIIEPWMKESKDLEELSISLRNASEVNEKANKNIYALGEEVTYYVDYKNGDSKTKKDVKLVLELPLDVTVVDAFGGVVNGKKITWTFPNGLAEDECGTKVVVVKYDSLGKASVKSKIVYPTADIYSASKVVDSSTVINLIFKDEDTKIINDEHYPYMYGDANATTFRPNDRITRAEGALVLTRIFGMNTSGVVIRNVYPDLGETYLEAQKAIVAATDAGIINGYTDKTYRPNEKMTRAEFMKIIAANIELEADEDDIRGLNVKDSTEEIKIYKNPTRSYVVNGQTITEHWASPYVTMLARLNMTDASSKNKDLRLDEPITRAEVAQLVNFYLFRAPAKVSSKTKSGFSDVTKSHKLFADIIEATRAAHSYTLTVEGTEVAIDD